LVPTEPPAQINGTLGSLDMQAWDLTRICQDTNLNYWAAAPIVTGAGITATRTANSIVQSVSSTRVASGRAALGGRLPAGKCSYLTRVYPQVKASDVVEFSLAEDPRSVPNLAKVQLQGYASNGKVNLRVCNGQAKDINVGRFSLNFVDAR
jgi:hypothetical protein